MTIRVKISQDSNHSDIKQWCRDNFGPDWWIDDVGTWSWVGLSSENVLEFEFFEEKDATLFLLRWG